MQQANTMATESLSQSKQFSPVSATSYWSHSKCEYTQINFEWTIDRLAIVQLPRDILTSPMFSAEETPEVKWKLWYKQTLDGDLQIRVSNRNTDLITPRPPDPYPVRVQMSILNRKREKILTRDEVLYEDPSYHPYLSFPNKNQEFFKSVSVQTDGSLIIYCEIHSLMKNETLSGMAITNAQHRQHRPFDCNNQLVSHLEELFENRMFTDITMSVGNSHFEVHKSILAVRSPVFAAMFAHLTSIENSSNKIEIQDVEPDVFQEVLRFIYTGRVPLTAMENVAAALLAAADKYFLDQLKKECEQHLSVHQMSAVNCLDLFALATHHPAEHLKANAVDFFRRFPAKVMATERWKKAKEENAVWLCELMEMVLLSVV